MTAKYLVRLVILLALAGSLCGATIYVDGDPNDSAVADSQTGSFRDIQEAINAAKDGDTIIVMPGRYLSTDPWKYGELKFNNKNICLQSSSPTDFEVIEKTILCGIVIFGGLETPNCRLQGFKIQNHDCGGILGNQTKAAISYCIISGNGPCGATVLKDCRGRISNSLIVDNTTFYGCSIQPVVSGCINLVNCTIANNLSPIAVGLTDGVLLHNCIVYGNNLGGQSVSTGWTGSSRFQITHSLVEAGNLITTDGHNVLTDATGGLAPRGGGTTPATPDPCFVRLGSWVGRTLTDGDYHLKSEGYRWSQEQMHGSHWYFDDVTSSCVDAGDPMDGLGNELERLPEDPAGQWGINHAIDMGAYGGTIQAGLAPTRGKAWGIGTVDLNDFWPLTAGNSWTMTGDSNRPEAQFKVVGESASPGSGLRMRTVQYTTYLPTVVETSYYAYFDYVLYKTLFPSALALLPEISDQLIPQYPQYLTIDSPIQVPEDASLARRGTSRSAVVVRGTLADVLAGTQLNRARLLSGEWTDTIAFRSQTSTGETGEPVTILTRGFGPLMLSGLPVTTATVDGHTFPASTSISGGGATRGS